MIVRFVRLAAPLSALAASLATWTTMPDPMPIHWGLDGRPDGWAPRAVGLLVLPLLSLGLGAGLSALAARDRSLAPKARDALELTLAAVAAFLAALHGLALGAAATDGRLSSPWVAAMLGALVLVLGSAMLDLEPNRWIGVRTEATLRDPAIWRLVHDKSAIAFMVAGGVAVIGAAVLPAPVALAAAVVLALGPGLGALAFAWALGRARR